MSTLKVDTIQHSGGTTGLTIDSNGNVTHNAKVFNPNRTSFKVYLSGNQSVTHQTWTTLALNTTTANNGGQTGWNIGSAWDTTNYRFNPEQAGYYHIGASAVLADTDSSYIQLAFKLNGYATAGSGTDMFTFTGVESGDGSSWHYVHGSGVIYLDSDDFISFGVYHNDGDASNVAGASPYTNGWGYLLA